MLLGLNVVKGLLMGISVFEIMQKVMAGLWDHSLGCAVVARAIAEKKGVKDPEEVSVAGLLHDLGKVILLLTYQPQYEAALEQAAKRRISIYEAEMEAFGQTHAIVGLWLAEKWHFPPNLVEVIGYHHRPSQSLRAPLETAIVHFADVLVRARGFGFAGDELAAAVHPATFELLALSEADIRDVLEKLENARDDAGDLVL
jgi:putative nucleotidyltransferase with HDIG domain